MVGKLSMLRTAQTRKSATAVTVALVPAYALLAFYAFISGWRVRLGHWSRYGNPDAGAFYGAFSLLRWETVVNGRPPGLHRTAADPALIGRR